MRPNPPDDIPPGWGYAMHGSTEVWSKQGMSVVRVADGWQVLIRLSNGPNGRPAFDFSVFPTACAAAVYMELNYVR